MHLVEFECLPNEVPEHAVLALGALSHLASNCRVAPAAKAAKDALEVLNRTRPDMRPPPPELVAEAIARLQEEHQRRVAEQEAADAAAEAEEAAAKAEAERKKAAKVIACGWLIMIECG